jgi:ribosomal-protein-alanine N-acetyltransferase
MSRMRKVCSPKSKTCSREPTPEELDRLARIPSAAQFLNSRFLVLFAEQEIAAFLAWRAVADDEFEILQLETIPLFRRQGFARKLLQTLILQNRGNLFLEVRESNAAARQLYQSEGFTEIARRRQYYCSPYEDAIVLRFRSC